MAGDTTAAAGPGPGRASPDPVTRRVSSFPGFGLRLTRWGGWYLAGMLLLGLAAVNTGNNALVMLLGVVMGSFVLSGTWSQQVLGLTRVEMTIPGRLFARRPEPVEMTLSNGSGIFPAYGLVVRAPDGSVLHTEPHLASRSRRRRTVSLRVDRRGWQEVGPFRLEVLLPLGFFVKTKVVAEARRVLVYPAPVPGGGPAVTAPPRGLGDRSTGRGRGGEVRQLRSFREGDEPRSIHWKQTARQQELITVEREAQVHEPLFVEVDPTVPDPGDPEWQELLERVVSAAAALVVERLEAGLPVGVVVGREVAGPVSTMSHLDVVMRPLALVEACPPGSGPPVRRPGSPVVRLSVLEAGP